MRKIISLLLLLALGLSLVSAASAAEAQRFLSLSGQIAAGRTVSVTAPFGGTLSDFTIKAGDTVTESDVLFTLGTTKVYAPIDGVVSGLRALPGDTAAQITERYGALLTLEPVSRFVVQADTNNAYNAEDNRIIHLGEVVYLLSRTSADRWGVGFVTVVDGKSYTIEMTIGNLQLNEAVTVFRNNEYKDDTRIGTGKTERIASVSVTAEGSVLDVHVDEGALVHRGDLLLETVTGALPGLAPVDSEVKAGMKAIVATVDVKSGANVTAGQVLATIYPLDSLIVTVSVSELDLPMIHVGMPVAVSPVGSRDVSLAGEVKSISALSAATEADADATFTVYIALEESSLARIGMHVDVVFGKEQEKPASAGQVVLP